MSSFLRFLRYTIICTILGLLLGMGAMALAYRLMAPRIPDVASLRDVQLQVPLRIVSKDDKLIAIYGENRRIPRDIADVPEHLKKAVLAAEDADFYQHHGIDIKGTARAGVRVILAAGRKVQGGSTITQQVARNFFLSSQKTYARKVTEILTALRIEEILSKDQILELYLNKMFLGHRNYGVGAAAQYYYGKEVENLTIAESAMIAASFQLPSLVNPLRKDERALNRRNWVLGQMRKRHFISDDEYQVALDTPLHGAAFTPPIEVHADYLAEMVRQEATKLIGNELLTDGYTIKTTIDSKKQNAAVASLRRGLLDYTHRHGYQGPEDQIELTDDSDADDYAEALKPYYAIADLLPGLVLKASSDEAQVVLRNGDHITLDKDSISWAKPYISHSRFGNKPDTVDQVVEPGDIIRVRQLDDDKWQLEQVPAVAGSLVSLVAEDGAIDTLVGGFSFNQSKYNRAIMVGSGRQPGSSFKPYVYAAAFDHGFNLASLINDAPVVFEDKSTPTGIWTPSNSSRTFMGPVRLRQALYQSKNLVSIRLLQAIGVDYARQYLTRFGFSASQLPPNLSLALGTASLSPMDMARGNAVLANGGYLVTPYAIASITKANSEEKYIANPYRACHDCRARQLTDKNEVVSLAQLDDWLHQGGSVLEPAPVIGPDDVTPERLAPHVVSTRTAYLVTSAMQDVIRRGTGRAALELERNDLAGKSRSTNDHRDAWFTGFNHTMATTVWVGFDNYESLGRGEFGARAALPIWIDYMGEALADEPESTLPQPPGITTVAVNRHTGLPTSKGDPDAINEIFKTEDVAKLRQKARRQTEQNDDADDLDIF